MITPLHGAKTWQLYLTMTPELLAEASARFERYASVDKETPHA